MDERIILNDPDAAEELLIDAAEQMNALRVSTEKELEGLSDLRTLIERTKQALSEAQMLLLQKLDERSRDAGGEKARAYLQQKIEEIERAYARVSAYDEEERLMRQEAAALLKSCGDLENTAVSIRNKSLQLIERIKKAK